MKILLGKSKINKVVLKKAIVRTIAGELTQLSEPCYYPTLHKFSKELYKLTGLTEKDVKEFIKRFWGNTKWGKFLLHKDPVTMLSIVIMKYFLDEKDQLAYQYMVLFHTIRMYTNRMHIQMKFCNPDTFKYTLEHLNKSHLFYREKTIPNALYYLSKQFHKKYAKLIQEENIDGIGKFVQEVRSRIAQSVKSFASLYYKAGKAGLSFRSPYEGEEGDNPYQFEKGQKVDRLVDEMSKKLIVYKFVDSQAMSDAKSLSKIKISLATLITKEVTNMEYEENLKQIYRLFVEGLKDVNQLCKKEFFAYVKRLMSIKRTNEKVYFKQQINLLLLKIIKKIKYDKQYTKFTTRTKFNINTFLAHYLTLILRNMLCQKY